MNDWFDKLRNLVPARTMALYVAITGMYPTVWPTAKDLPEWVPFVAIGACLVVQMVFGIARKKKAWAIALSAIAFVLFGLTQPYSGILGVFDVPGAVNFVFAVITLVYIFLVATFYKGNLAEEGS